MLRTEYNFTHNVLFYKQCIILHKVYMFQTYIEFELPDISLHCFVANLRSIKCKIFRF